MNNPKHLPEVKNPQKVAGVDGCKNGWVLVRPDGDGSYWWKASHCFKQLMEEEDDLELVLVDMPIGLSSAENSGKNAPFRTVDWRLKEWLGSSSSSVFIPPTREAARAPSKEEAHQKNRELVGSALQPPSAGIRENVDELDRYLIEHAEMTKRIRESHPELAFQLLNGNKPLSHKKSVDKGIEERLELIENSDLRRLPGNLEIGVEMSTDDLVDALCLCSVAKNGVQEGFSALRNDPDHPDAAGIPIELLFPRVS